MKTLKLQVGKTYRNRRGEEVKIVRMGNKGWDYWEGSNGEWYYEGGKWSYITKEHPEDLVEEVSSEPTRHTFDIPDGVKKITLDYFGNRIVVEMVPEAKEPKPGDVMINKYGSVYILKSIVGKVTHKYFAHLGKSGRLAIDMSCHSGRPATPEEAQPLWDALKKAGKRWNPHTMQVEDIEPKPGDVMINIHGNVYIFKEVVGEDVHKYYAWAGEGGRLNVESLCFCGRPATPEEAQTLWDALKKAGKRWNAETMQVEDVPEKDRILEWVEENLNDVYYSKQCIAKVIGYYLKHREGEK